MVRKMKISIGRIIAIDNLNIKVELFDKYISSYAIFNGEAIRVGGVFNIVLTSNFVYQIVSENITEINDNSIFEKRIINCQLLGYIKNNNYFEGTNGDTPNIYDIVYMAEEDILKKVYSNISGGLNAEVGYYTMMQNLKFEFDINKVFASHILIVGNTGSGKSNTLAKLYESLFSIEQLNFKKSKFLVIDTNGELEKSFSENDDLKKIIDVGDESNGLKIPIQYIDANNWGLILDATEKTQMPILKSVIKRLKKIYNNEINIKGFVNDSIHNLVKTIISSQVQPNQRLLSLEKVITGYWNILEKSACDDYTNTLGCYFINNGRITKYGDQYSDYSSDLLEELKKINLFSKDTLDVYSFEYLIHLEYLNRIYKYNVTENNISPMMVRLSQKVDLLNKHILSYDGTQKSLIQFIDNLFDSHPILILNMESCNKELKTLFVSLLAEKIYDYAIEKKKKKRKGSYHLIIEEAHNYLAKKDRSKEDALYDNCLDLFEKIIKEGRKYGLFMTISTQCPSEITETIISQTHNFFIHKLINPKDVSIIKSAVPFMDEMSYKMLPILSPGQCIVTGTAFKKPNIVQITLPKNAVESKTISLVSLWK